ncbi:PH domain-containing protein [Nocardiopsis sp. RSe5-2]|uniref:PH domain-containing protein n=1 Tax=Nocardiopsis endophytica TaxID=3018445 RepID=A0ABT4U9K6_9ACTN|nr:PH domain-containing protein [Nocardiopsis endophytica]MDA2813641.1 PH domain-containing protein [Nocardiopsis endophytica]
MSTQGITHSGSARTAVRLRPPRHRVAGRAVALWTLRALLLWAPPTAVAAGLATASGITGLVPQATGPLWVLTAALGALGLLVALVMPQWRYRVHRWEVTGEAVYTSFGWLWQEWRVAPMARIQTVDTERGPLQRALGLATLTVTTASAAGPLRIDGLDAALAADVAQQLTEVTQAIPGDGT